MGKWTSSKEVIEQVVVISNKLQEMFMEMLIHIWIFYALLSILGNDSILWIYPRTFEIFVEVEDAFNETIVEANAIICNN